MLSRVEARRKPKAGIVHLESRAVPGTQQGNYNLVISVGIL